MFRHSVISSKDRDAGANNARRMAALPCSQPLGQIFEAAKCAGRLNEFVLSGTYLVCCLPIRSRQAGH
jgi:hypothetical protein